MSDFRIFVRELRRGKSLGRTLLNLVFSRITLSGLILDVGGGGRKRLPSYRLFMQTTPDCAWMTADYDRTLQPQLCFDANRRWPVKDGACDSVLLSNCLYIFPHPQFVLQEAARVLRTGGQLVVVAPLVFQESPEPTDYFRFTSQGIRLLVQNAGLNVAALTPFGGRFTCVVDLMRPYLKKLCLFLPAAIVARWSDRVCQKRVAFESRHPVAFGYIVVARK